MRLRFPSLLVCLSAGLLLSACKGPKGDPGPSATDQKGNLYGFVRTYDEFGGLTPKNGVTVTLENTTPAITAVTNDIGRFELQNAPTSTYNIAYSKAGYGTIRQFGYPHVGGGQPANLYTAELNQISTSTLRNLTADFSTAGSSSLQLSALVSNTSLVGRQFQARIFVGANANVTSTTGDMLTTIRNASPSPTGTSTVDFLISTRDFVTDYLHQLGYAAGSTAYLVAYPSPNNYYGYNYNDPITSRPVYTALGAPSNVVRITVP